MNQKASRLLAALAIVGACLTVPPAVLAGTTAHPEIDDGNDDVNVNGVCSTGFGVPPCPSHDFVWGGADLDYAYANDNATSILLTIGLKDATGFTTATPGETAFSPDYDYLFSFTVGTATYQAKAHFPHGGTITAGGVATAAKVNAGGNELTLVVPKAATPGIANGVALTQLFCQVDGKGTNGFTLSDRAPNANFGLDYKIANSTVATARSVFYVPLNGTSVLLSKSFATPTTATIVYNWTGALPKVDLSYAAKVANGTVHVKVVDGAAKVLANRTFAATGNVTQKSASATNGTWHITLDLTHYQGNVSVSIAKPNTVAPVTPKTPATPFVPPSAVTTSPTTSASASGSTTESSTTKGSPGLGLLAFMGGLGAALVALRRRV